MIRINGAELIAALPVYNETRGEIERFYVVLDKGNEYVTTWVSELAESDAEWPGSGRYTTSLLKALDSMQRVAAQCSAAINGNHDVA